MKRKTSIILISILSVIIAISILSWFAINLIFIPKVIVPKISEYINANFEKDIKFTVSDISFHPISGFQFKDIELSGPVILKDNYILHAESADIDLAFLPLLRKRIEVKRFEISDIDLNIGRDGSGKWNFAPLVELGCAEEKNMGKFSFIIKKFKLENCSIDYTDYKEKDNVLERRFTNTELLFANPRSQLYKLVLSGGDPQRSNESLELKLDYNKRQKSVEGTVRFNTIYLDQYWDYYLDDILKPWHLKADNINSNLSFSYHKDTLSLNGQHTLSNAILSYGDLSIKGNASMEQTLKHVKDAPSKNVTLVDLYLDNISSLSGEHVFLNKGECKAVITEEEITIHELSGMMSKESLSFKGRFRFADPRELNLTGKIGDIDNTFVLKVENEDEGTADWQIALGNSGIKIHAGISNLKDMAFDLKAEGNMQMPDLALLLKTDEDKIKGEVNLSGNITGEMDKPNSLQGKININVKDLSVLDLEPESFDFNMDIKDGLFSGNIPKTDFYKGNLYGTVLMDLQRWGLELHVDNFNIATKPELQGMKGIFTASAAYMCEWTDFSAIKGGGYFELDKCDLWNAPIFKATEKGIESITSDIEAPDFKKLDGSFEIKQDGVLFQDVSAKTSGMNLRIMGKYYYSGEVDFTVGARFMGKGLFKTARQILLPVTIGFDIAANSIQVKITGKWPDLSEKTELQPIGWLTAIFPDFGATPGKYTLKKLWD